MEKTDIINILIDLERTHDGISGFIPSRDFHKVADKILQLETSSNVIPDVVGRLQSLKRYDQWSDMTSGYECHGMDEDDNGNWVEWENIEKLMEGLKTDNAL